MSSRLKIPVFNRSFFPPHQERLANPPAAVFPVLQAAYITAWGHALYHLTLDLLFALGALSLAAALLWRNLPDRLAVRAAFTLTTWGLTNGVMIESLLSDRWWTWLVCGLGWGIWLFFLAHNLWLHHQRLSLSLRQRVRWHLYGAATSLVGIVLVVATVGSALTLPPQAIDRHMTGHLLLAGSIFPATLAAAWLLPTLLDPDTLINRTLFYGALTGIIV